MKMLKLLLSSSFFVVGCKGLKTNKWGAPLAWTDSQLWCGVRGMQWGSGNRLKTARVSMNAELYTLCCLSNNSLSLMN